MELTALENDKAIIYCLDSNLRISYCNAAWDEFAGANNGDQLKRPAPIGLGLADFVDPSLLGFYTKALKTVRETGVPWEHYYGCSSSTTRRRYHQRVSKATLRGVQSLVVVNSQVVDEPNPDVGLDPATDAAYRKDGLIKMCLNCRRTWHPEQDIWYSVPKYIEQVPDKTTSGLCTPCLVADYPEFFSSSPLNSSRPETE